MNRATIVVYSFGIGLNFGLMLYAILTGDTLTAAISGGMAVSLVVFTILVAVNSTVDEDEFTRS